MMSSRKLAVAVFVAFAGAPAVFAAEGGTEATVGLGKATLGDAVSNDQKEMLAPGPGKRFLWVAAKLSGPPMVVDLTKVALVSGSETFTLIGVDSAHDGEAKEFSMIAQALSNSGKVGDPLPETRSTGFVSFAFSPKTKTATLKLLQPPETVCLLFSVPSTLKAGQINGLGAKPLPLPALATTARH